MNAGVLIFFLIVAACALAGVVVRRRAGQQASVDPAWLDAFSASQYRPMERLLCEDDFKFLGEQPGFHPAIASQLRSKRRRIFSAYLRSLVRDFNRIHAAAVQCAMSAATDQAEFTSILMRQKMTFQMSVIDVRCRLALYSLGVGAVDVKPLVDALSALSAGARELRTASVSAAA